MHVYMISLQRHSVQSRVVGIPSNSYRVFLRNNKYKYIVYILYIRLFSVSILFCCHDFLASTNLISHQIRTSVYVFGVCVCVSCATHHAHMETPGFEVSLYNVTVKVSIEIQSYRLCPKNFHLYIKMDRLWLSMVDGVKRFIAFSLQTIFIISQKVHCNSFQ